MLTGLRARLGDTIKLPDAAFVNMAYDLDRNVNEAFGMASPVGPGLLETLGAIQARDAPREIRFVNAQVAFSAQLTKLTESALIVKDFRVGADESRAWIMHVALRSGTAVDTRQSYDSPTVVIGINHHLSETQSRVLSQFERERTDDLQARLSSVLNAYSGIDGRITLARGNANGWRLAVAYQPIGRSPPNLGWALHRLDSCHRALVSLVQLDVSWN